VDEGASAGPHTHNPVSVVVGVVAQVVRVGFGVVRVGVAAGRTAEAARVPDRGSGH